MVKQHHIAYEKMTNQYWFILPDNTEKELSINQIEDIDFNVVYIEMYKLYLSNRERYDKLKKMEVEDMIAELHV